MAPGGGQHGAASGTGHCPLPWTGTAPRMAHCHPTDVQGMPAPATRHCQPHTEDTAPCPLPWHCHPQRQDAVPGTAVPPPTPGQRQPRGSPWPGRAHFAWRWHCPLLHGARRGRRQGAERGVAPGQGWAHSGLGEIERNKEIRGQILRGGLGGSKGLLLGWEAALRPWETHLAPQCSQWDTECQRWPGRERFQGMDKIWGKNRHLLFFFFP